MKPECTVKQITFDCTKASLSEALYISVPRLNENNVLVLGSLALLLDVDLSGGHANNFLVQNVTPALVDKLLVKFEGTVLQEMVDYDIYKTFEDLFLSQEQRDGMIIEGIQSKDLCKVPSGTGDKKTSGVTTENKLNGIYGIASVSTIRSCLTTAFSTPGPCTLTLAPASQVVKDSDQTKLKYKLTNIQL